MFIDFYLRFLDQTQVIKENGTVLMVGAIEDIYLPEGIHNDEDV